MSGFDSPGVHQMNRRRFLARLAAFVPGSMLTAAIAKASEEEMRATRAMAIARKETARSADLVSRQPIDIGLTWLNWYGGVEPAVLLFLVKGCRWLCVITAGVTAREQWDRLG